MRLTPDILRAAYDFLRTTPPFKGWRLPPGEEISFVVSREPDRHGVYWWKNKRHVIGVSEINVSHTDIMIRIMAHEMIHLHQQEEGSTTPNTEHNARFKKLKTQAAKTHGFDPKDF